MPDEKRKEGDGEGKKRRCQMKECEMGYQKKK